jgi:hypothetical protein
MSEGKTADSTGRPSDRRKLIAVVSRGRYAIMYAGRLGLEFDELGARHRAVRPFESPPISMIMDSPKGDGVASSIPGHQGCLSVVSG